MKEEKYLISLAASGWWCWSSPWWYGGEQQAFVCRQNGALYGVTTGFQTSETGENYTVEFLSLYECFISHVNRSESHPPPPPPPPPPHNHPFWHWGSCACLGSKVQLTGSWLDQLKGGSEMKTGSDLQLKQQHGKILEKDVLIECTCENHKKPLSARQCWSFIKVKDCFTIFAQLRLFLHQVPWRPFM